jgi:hypothetical protein
VTRFSALTFQISSLALRGKALAIVVGVALTGLLSLGVADDRPVYSGSAKVAGPAMLGRKGKRDEPGDFGVMRRGVEAHDVGSPRYALLFEAQWNEWGTALLTVWLGEKVAQEAA